MLTKCCARLTPSVKSWRHESSKIHGARSPVLVAMNDFDACWSGRSPPTHTAFGVSMRCSFATARCCRRFGLAVVAALGLGVITAPAASAQNTDVIRGRVTNTEGLPLPNVRVTATSIPGNVTREIRSNGQGNFQIAFPNGTGDYIMGYALIGYDFRQFEIKRAADEDVLIADARL